MNLDVDVLDGFEISPTGQNHGIHGQSKIYTRRGDAKVPYWSSRETHVDSGAGSASGRFSLRDVLSIRSISGSIDAQIHPEKADKDKPLPAKCSVVSDSGSIYVDSELYDVPEREYKTYIHSRSSYVEGSIIHGTETEITTNSGSIDLSVLPYRAREKDGSIFVTDIGGS